MSLLTTDNSFGDRRSREREQSEMEPYLLTVSFEIVRWLYGIYCSVLSMNCVSE